MSTDESIHMQIDGSDRDEEEAATVCAVFDSTHPSYEEIDHKTLMFVLFYFNCIPRCVSKF